MVDGTFVEFGRPGAWGMAVTCRAVRRLKELGRLTPCDDSTADWELRFDRCVGRGRRGRLRVSVSARRVCGGDRCPRSGQESTSARPTTHCVVINADGQRLLS